MSPLRERLYGSTIRYALLSVLEAVNATIVYFVPRTGSIDTVPTVAAPVAVFTDQSEMPMLTSK